MNPIAGSPNEYDGAHSTVVYPVLLFNLDLWLCQVMNLGGRRRASREMGEGHLPPPHFCGSLLFCTGQEEGEGEWAVFTPPQVVLAPHALHPLIVASARHMACCALGLRPVLDTAVTLIYVSPGTTSASCTSSTHAGAPNGTYTPHVFSVSHSVSHKAMGNALDSVADDAPPMTPGTTLHPTLHPFSLAF